VTVRLSERESSSCKPGILSFPIFCCAVSIRHNILRPTVRHSRGPHTRFDLRYLFLTALVGQAEKMSRRQAVFPTRMALTTFKGKQQGAQKGK
jgi:hypothetical protein